MKRNANYTCVMLIAAWLLTVIKANAQQRLQQVFTDKTYQLTGIAVSAKGRLFVNYPLWSATYKYAVVEVLPNGTVKPYPDAVMNSWKKGEDGKNKWVCVQAVYVDDNDYLYVVDPSAPMLNVVYQNSNKVVKIDLKTNKIVHTYFFNGTTDNHSYINDIRVDTKKQMAYLTNSGEGGIVILNLANGKTRQVLQGDKSVLSDPGFKFIIDGHLLMKQGQPAKFQSDGIALTPAGDWLYYKPLSDKKLYRVKTADLLNEKLSKEQLQGKVEYLGEIATTDGMIFDKKGNLYMGDLQNYTLLQVPPDLKVKKFVKDTRLIWPDSYAVSNGYLYVSTSQIQKQPTYNNGVNKRTTPYAVYKIKLP